MHGRDAQSYRVGNLAFPDIRKVPVYIYGLAEPDTMFIRYIGKTGKLKSRYADHLRCVKSSPRISKWVRALAEKGQRPKLLILLVVAPGDDVADAERTLINAHKAHHILNTHGLRDVSVQRDANCDPFERLPPAMYEAPYSSAHAQAAE